MEHSAIDAPPLAVRADEDFMFSNRKHAYKPRLEKRQRRLLAKIPDLAGFLRPTEQVMLVTTCCSPTSILEQMTTGWVVYYINRALLVVTNQRIFHVPTTMSYGYRGSIAQIDYGDCADIRVRGRSLVVRYHNGRKERFLYLGGERGKLKDYFKEISALPIDSRPPETPIGRRHHLCPRCTAPLRAGVYQCAGCRLEFKDSRAATLLSVAVPGGGYFYTGHWLLGLGDLVIESILLLLVFSSVVDANAGDPGAWGAAVVFGFALAVEKLITVYHARHYVSEYLPKEPTIRLRTSAARAA